ncbi:hypothetical protein [Streptomyces griseofuscus]|uniref:hypothetical protein n=1 Tax=Streptomyces griseofuscus TaxID=146922 RepID=UPI00380E0AB0
MIGVVVALVTVTADGAEAEGAEDGVVPAPAFEEPLLGPGDAAALVGLPPLPAWTGSAAPSPPKTLIAPTLNAATPAATLNGSPHLRTSEVCSSS